VQCNLSAVSQHTPSLWKGYACQHARTHMACATRTFGSCQNECTLTEGEVGAPHSSRARNIHGIMLAIGERFAHWPGCGGRRHRQGTVHAGRPRELREWYCSGRQDCWQEAGRVGRGHAEVRTRHRRREYNMCMACGEVAAARSHPLRARLRRAAAVGGSEARGARRERRKPIHPPGGRLGRKESLGGGGRLRVALRAWHAARQRRARGHSGGRGRPRSESAQRARRGRGRCAALRWSP